VPMSIITVDPRTDPRWQALVAGQNSSVFHAPGWMNVLADAYGFEPRALIALDDGGQPEAGISYCHIEDIWGERIVTRPFSDYCDPLVRSEAQWERLSAPLVEHKCSVTVRCLHNRIPLGDPRFVVVNQAKWHGIDLRPSRDLLWARLPEPAQRAIRKAEKQGVVVRPAETKADLRAFFALHLGVRKRKYALVAQPYRFFEAIWDQFVARDAGVVLLAEVDRQVVGGIFFLAWKDTFYYKFNASDPAALGVRPNDLLLWQGMALAQEKGFVALDFGLSDWDQDGLIRYKRKYASEEGTIFFLEHRPAPPGPDAAHTRRLFNQLTALFTDPDVPDAVTERGGDVLYRYFV